MNTSDLLSAEERELARLLGRPGPAAGPSPGLDAAVLAMARAPAAPAAETPPAAAPVAAPLPVRPRTTGWGRRRRVVSSLAAVASLVLVVGLAWQLRPLPPQPGMALPAATESQAAPADAPTAEAPPLQQSADAAANQATLPATGMAETEPVPPPPPAPARARAQAAPAAAAPVAEPAAAEVIAPPAAYSTAILPPAPPAPPAPAPAAISAPVEQQADAFPAADAGADRASVPQRPQTPRPVMSAPIPHAGAKATAKAVEARREQAQAADIEADGGLSRHQWLKRIRERRDNGDLDGARASLRQFVQDYPEARVPRDLRPLLEP
ncbi:hypothetical protein VA603_16825 [Stenotrophomonas sp. MH1]|uniref:Transmembrane protein n=1 Tax=Stenotrophomonas capsici TaxID=3110230 RepID=A0ABU5V779_9GAMM|nr:hypothetical protein [Stenotrophomonas sp. MH1]MEA5669199.1 hypothetical protein [Stenotrophomonas sp. MH1]